MGFLVSSICKVFFSFVEYLKDGIGMKIKLLRLLPVIGLLILAGCGGGGSSSIPASSEIVGITTDGTNTQYPTLYITDFGLNLVESINSQTGVITAIAGQSGVIGTNTNAAGTGAQFNGPEGIILSSGSLYIADAYNYAIRKIAGLTATSTVTTLSGVLGTPGNVDTAQGSPEYGNPKNVATDGSNFYVTDYANNTVRKITSAGTVTTLASGFSGPWGIVIDPTNTYLYVTDTGNNNIKQITISTGSVITFAGTIGGNSGVPGTGTANGTAAFFNSPLGIAIDASGNNLYVADSGNNAIRQITIAGSQTVSTVAGSTSGAAGTGTSANGSTGATSLFSTPINLAYSQNGNLYVVDQNGLIIRVVNISTGATSNLP